MSIFFISSGRLQTRCALLTEVQTCALPIWTETLTKVLAVAGKTVADLYLADAGIQPALVNPPFNPHDLPRDVPIHGTAMGGSLEVRSNGELSQIEETLVEDGVVGSARRPARTSVV